MSSQRVKQLLSAHWSYIYNCLLPLEADIFRFFRKKRSWKFRESSQEYICYKVLSSKKRLGNRYWFFEIFSKYLEQSFHRTPVKSSLYCLKTLPIKQISRLFQITRVVSGVAAGNCNLANVDTKFRNRVGSVPVGGNIPSLCWWTVWLLVIQQKERHLLSLIKVTEGNQGKSRQH